MMHVKWLEQCLARKCSISLLLYFASIAAHRTPGGIAQWYTVKNGTPGVHRVNGGPGIQQRRGPDCS